MNDDTEIKILGIVAEGVTYETNYGSPESTLYTVPLLLSWQPSDTWIEFFLDAWKKPMFSPNPDIVEVDDSMIFLNGTTLDDIDKYHKKALKKRVNAANEEEKKHQKREELFRKYIEDRTNEIKF